MLQTCLLSNRANFLAFPPGGQRQKNSAAARRTAGRKFQKFENNSGNKKYFSRAGRNYFKSPASRHLSLEPVRQGGLPNDRSQSSVSVSVSAQLNSQDDYNGSEICEGALYFGQAIATPPCPPPPTPVIHWHSLPPPTHS